MVTEVLRMSGDTGAGFEVFPATICIAVPGAPTFRPYLAGLFLPLPDRGYHLFNIEADTTHRLLKAYFFECRKINTCLFVTR